MGEDRVKDSKAGPSSTSSAFEVNAIHDDDLERAETNVPMGRFYARNNRSGPSRLTHVYAQVFHFLDKTNTWPRILYQVIILAAIFASLFWSILGTLEHPADKYMGDVFELIITIILFIEYSLLITLVIYVPDHAGYRGWMRFVFSYSRVIDLLLVIVSVAMTAYHFFAIADTREDLLILSYIRLIRIERFTNSLPLIFQIVKKNTKEFLGILYMGTMIIILFSIIEYYIERNHNTKFDDMPASIYWAIISLTTVGYGDSTPNTNGGKAVACIAGIVGMWFFALPAGLLGTAIALRSQNRRKKYKHIKTRRFEAVMVIQSFGRLQLNTKRHGRKHPETLAARKNLEFNVAVFKEGRLRRSMENDYQSTVLSIQKKLDILISNQRVSQRAMARSISQGRSSVSHVHARPSVSKKRSGGRTFI